MNEGSWVERGDVYSVTHDEWLERYIGYYRTANGMTRPCGHRHKDEGRAKRCAEARMKKVLLESR